MNPKALSPELADLLAEGYYLADGDLRLLWANRSLREAFGCADLAELNQAMNSERFVRPLSEALSSLKQEGRALNLEVVLRTKQGRTLAATEHIFRLGQESQGGPAYLGLVDFLSGEARNYRLLAENMTEVVCQLDDQGTIVYVSPSLRPTLGYNASEVVGQKIFEYLHQDDLFRASEDFDRYARRGTAEDLIYRVRHANGQYLWMAVRARLLYDRDFLVAGLVLTARDISEAQRLREEIEAMKLRQQEELVQRTAEAGRIIEELKSEIAQRKEADRREAESRFRQEAIMRVMPAVLYTAQLGTPMAAVWMSENVSYVTGYPVEKFLQEPGFWIDRVHPQDRETVEEYLQQVASGRILATEYRWLCADGEYHWFLDQVVNVQISEKSVTEYFGIWIDITAREDIKRKVTGGKGSRDNR